MRGYTVVVQPVDENGTPVRSMFAYPVQTYTEGLNVAAYWKNDGGYRAEVVFTSTRDRDNIEDLARRGAAIREGK